MDRETVLVLMQRRPFEPFSIATHDGTMRNVPHPECIALGGDGLVFIDPRTNQMALIPYSAISAIESVASMA